MRENYTQALKARLDKESFRRLSALHNPKLHRFVAEYVELCNPASVYVATDSAEDIAYVRSQALERGEERPLATEGHTVHFDGSQRPGPRPRSHPVPGPRSRLPGQALNQIDREEGLDGSPRAAQGHHEGRGDDRRASSASGRPDSVFSHPLRADHRLLLRRATARTCSTAPATSSSRAHGRARTTSSASCTPPAELDERTSAPTPDKRRIYIDYTTDMIYSVNTQYAGNTVGPEEAGPAPGHPQGRPRRLAGRAHVPHGRARAERPQDLLQRRLPQRLRQDLHGHAPGRDDRRRRPRLPARHRRPRRAPSTSSAASSASSRT